MSPWFEKQRGKHDNCRTHDVTWWVILAAFPFTSMHRECPTSGIRSWMREKTLAPQRGCDPGSRYVYPVTFLFGEHNRR